MPRFALSLLAGALGVLGSGFNVPAAQSSCTSQPPSAPEDNFISFRLVSSRYESHNTRRFYFAPETPGAGFPTPIASCIVAKFTDADGKEVIRPFTPISLSGNTVDGGIELLVKRNPNRKMGNHLFNLKAGDSLLMQGPYVKFSYRPNQWAHVGMLAGGTGITPMYQVIKGVLENQEDRTKISLIYGNDKVEDILLANELATFTSTYKNFHFYPTLLHPPKRWLGGIGYINREMISAFFPPPQEKNGKILVCGPPPMMKAFSGTSRETFSGLLKDMGYSADQVFRF